jgi:hypothetical protein
MSTPDPTKEIKIKNSTMTPISILLPTTSSESADANGTMVYGESLEMLTSVDGDTAIPASSTKTFVLDQSYTDPHTGKPAYSTIYDLLPSTSTWLMPVANLGVMQSFDDPPSYPAQTVTADSAAAFQDAATFIQTISAYPTSALATGYQAAVNQATNNSSGQADGSSDSGNAVAQSIDDTVNAFFRGTKTYQKVTLAAVVAVQSYYGTFPFVWAEFATGTTTYYLYKSNGTATSFVGTISLTPPAEVNITKANGGYTCTFTPASNGSDTTNVNVNTAGAKSLTYTGGLFVDDVRSDLPQVAMKGTFQIKSLFTNNSADTQVIPVLAGTLDGATCIGFDKPQLSTDTSSSFWDSLFNPKNSAQLFQSVMTIGGALMMLVFAGQVLFGIYKWARNLGAAKQPTEAEAVRAKLQEFQESQAKTLEALFKRYMRGNGEAPTTEDEAMKIIESETTNIRYSQSAAELTNGFKAQGRSLEELAQYAEDMTTSQFQTLQTEAGNIRASVSDLQNATKANLGETVAKETPKLADTVKGISTLTTEVGKTVNQSTQASIKENAEVSIEAAKTVDDLAEAEEHLKGETDPIAEDTIKVEGGL